MRSPISPRIASARHLRCASWALCSSARKSSILTPRFEPPCTRRVPIALPTTAVSPLTPTSRKSFFMGSAPAPSSPITLTNSNNALRTVPNRGDTTIEQIAETRPSLTKSLALPGTSFARMMRAGVRRWKSSALIRGKRHPSSSFMVFSAKWTLVLEFITKLRSASKLAPRRARSDFRSCPLSSNVTSFTHDAETSSSRLDKTATSSTARTAESLVVSFFSRSTKTERP